MKLSAVALKLRLADTSFEDRIGGSAALALAVESTLAVEMVFVIPLLESTNDNEYDNTINQVVTERFGLVVALKMDDDLTDKTGIQAFDRLHDIRSEFFKALLGWQMPEAESICAYAGASFLDFHRGWLWYQYSFEVKTRLGSEVELDMTDVSPFDRIYAQWVLGPWDGSNAELREALKQVAPRLPADETDPADGLRLIDMAQMIQREED